MINRLLCFLWLLSGLWLHGQQAQDSVRIDSNSVLYERATLNDLNQKYQGDEFNYAEDVGVSSNLIDRFIKWLGKILSNTFGWEIDKATFIYIRWIFYFCIFCLVVYLLYRFLKNENMVSLFSKEPQNLSEVKFEDRHIDEIDFQELMSQALAAKDYRLAIRYLFLSMLKDLSGKTVIEWNNEKTNNDYKSEIKDANVKNLFGQLVYLYEYIWYGEQEVDGAMFEKAKLKFNQMDQLV